MKNSVLLTDSVKQPHKFCTSRTVNHIIVSVLADISFLKTRKMNIELPVKILAVAFAQSQSHSETQHTPDACLNAHSENCPDVFFRVVDKRQNRAQPHHCRNTRVAESFQRFKPLICSADVWFDNPAQLFVSRRQRHLYNCLCLFVDLSENIQIPQHKIRFRLKCNAEAVFFNEQKGFTGVSEIFFEREIRVCHRACANHAALSFSPESGFEQLERVFLDLDVLEVMIHLIAFAARVAVYAAMRAAAV